MWDKLAPDVYAELTDERFLNRSHYKKATYAQGCRGPLCRKLERDDGRKETEAKALAAGRTYRPQRTPAQARDKELNLVIVWHLAERSTILESTSETATF